MSWEFSSAATMARPARIPDGDAWTLADPDTYHNAGRPSGTWREPYPLSVDFRVGFSVFGSGPLSTGNIWIEYSHDPYVTWFETEIEGKNLNPGYTSGDPPASVQPQWLYGTHGWFHGRGLPETRFRARVESVFFGVPATAYGAELQMTYRFPQTATRESGLLDDFSEATKDATLGESERIVRSIFQEPHRRTRMVDGRQPSILIEKAHAESFGLNSEVEVDGRAFVVSGIRSDSFALLRIQLEEVS